MGEVTKLLSVGSPFGPTEHPFRLAVLDIEAKKQAFDLIWQQVQVEPIISKLNILSDQESTVALKNFVIHPRYKAIVIGCYSDSKKLIAVDILLRRKFRALPLQQDEFTGEACGKFVKYLNLIHKHVQANYQKMDQNKYYLTSLFTKPLGPITTSYSSEIQREMIYNRKLVAKRLGIEVFASAFVGEEMQGVAESFKYKDLKVNREEMLQLGLEGFLIKIMGIEITIKQEINPRKIMRSGLRKIEVVGAVRVLTKMHFTNIRGLHSNLSPVRHHLETEKPHLLFLTDSKIEPSSDVAYLNCQGYKLEHKFKRNAGVCVYVRDDLSYQRLRCYEDERLSTLWLLVDTGSHKTIYVGVYRSPRATRFFDHLTEKAKLVQYKYPVAELVFLGDFNAHHKKWLFPYQYTDSAGREARQFAKSQNLRQMVGLPTRVPDADGQTSNCLDLLLTTDPGRHSVSVWAPLGSSDHRLVKSVSSCASVLSFLPDLS